MKGPTTDLRSSDRRQRLLRQLMAAAAGPVVVSAAGPKLRCLAVSPAFAALLGVKPGALVGQTPASSAMLPDPGRSPALAEVLKTGQSRQNFELQLRTADGRELVFLCAARIARIGGARCLWWSGVELSARRHQVREDRRFIRLLRQVVASGPLRLRAVDRDARTIVYEGPPMRVGKGRKSTLGRAAGELLKEHPLLVAPLNQALAGEKSFLAFETGDSSDLYYFPLPDTDGGTGGAAVIGVDAGARRIAAKELQVRLRQQAALAAVGQHALASPDLQELFARAAAALVEGMAMDYGLAFRLVEAGDKLELAASAGLEAGVEIPRELQREERSLAGQTTLEPAPVVVSDLAAEGRFKSDPLVRGHAVQTLACVPLAGSAKRVYGMLGVFSRARREFSPDDINFLQALAAIVGGAVDRARGEGELMRSERFFRHLVEHTSDVIRVLDQHGTILFESPATSRVLGLEPAEVIGRNAFEMLAPGGAEIARPMLVYAFAHPGQPYTDDFRLVHKDGSLRECESSYKVVADGDEPPVLIADIRDMTQRRRAQAAQRLLASLVQFSNQAITSRDLDMRLTSWNPAAERLYGYQAAEVLGRTESFVEAAMLEREMGYLRQVLGGGSAQWFESARRRKDGTTVEVAVTFSPIRDGEGRLVGVTTISYDLSERRLAARARELARVNVELSQFASVVSHDLQEPLNTITAYVNLLGERLGEEPDGEGAEFMAYILDAAGWMRSLIRDLLTYSHASSAAQGFKVVELAAVLDQVRSNLAGAIEELKATLLAPPLPTVMGDASALIQLFQNLLSNALKFHGPQPPRVDLGVTRVGREWQFEVRDNGIGMEPVHARKIFEPFQRLHNRTEYPGTGIGLALCKKIVERHGGRIWVESQPGRGASFYFTLPAELLSAANG